MATQKREVAAAHAASARGAHLRSDRLVATDRQNGTPFGTQLARDLFGAAGGKCAVDLATIHIDNAINEGSTRLCAKFNGHGVGVAHDDVASTTSSKVVWPIRTLARPSTRMG